MTLNELAEIVYQNSVDHGWWESERNFGESLALIHAEVSEVLEDWRRGAPLNEILWKVDPDTGLRAKPDGIPIEFADVIIRVLELCGAYKIDIDTAIAEKVAFNKDRPYRHGGLKA
jgi:NTP pyrophosphatase (non-canonical NTP hydrolase)